MTEMTREERVDWLVARGVPRETAESMLEESESWGESITVDGAPLDH